jgi:hypothetical protein
MVRNESFFLKNSVNDDVFFKSGVTNELKSFDDSYSTFVSNLNLMDTNAQQLGVPVLAELSVLKVMINEYKSSFSDIVKAIKKKGYRDYGIEGEMRKYAHELHDKNSKIEIDKVLMLRRHEKDYLMRNDEEYIIKYKLLVDELKTNILNDNKLTNSEIDYYIKLLYNYQGAFMSLVNITKQVSIKNNDSMLSQMEFYKNKLDIAFGLMQDKLKVYENKMLKNLIFGFLLVGGNLLLLCILFVFLYFKYSRSSQDAEVLSISVENDQLKQINRS